MRRISKTALVTAVATGWPAAAYAQSLEGTKLVTGTKALIQDATTIITGMLALIATIVMLWLFVRSMLAGDEHEKAALNRKLKGAAVIFAVALSVSGLLTAISSYFQ
jgi:uncharacterized membrane protein